LETDTLFAVWNRFVNSIVFEVTAKVSSKILVYLLISWKDVT